MDEYLVVQAYKNVTNSQRETILLLPTIILIIENLN